MPDIKLVDIKSQKTNQGALELIDAILPQIKSGEVQSILIVATMANGEMTRAFSLGTDIRAYAALIAGCECVKHQLLNLDN